MKRLMITCLVLAPGIASAHHFPANFDLEVTDFEVTGRIASVSFRNPHSVIQLLVEAADGTSPSGTSSSAASTCCSGVVGTSTASRPATSSPVSVTRVPTRRLRCIFGGADYPVEIILAPDSEPIVLWQAYTRAPPDTRMLEYECTEGMWLDHEAARERRQAQ